MIATRKVTFQERSNKEQDVNGLKGGPRSFDRTRFKSHRGNRVVNLQLESFQAFEEPDHHLVGED